MTVDWSAFERPTPPWFLDAKLGIFIHWGPYSVPAWAEPTGELGAVDEHVWFRHNPYAEWYANTIRFEDSPARAHQRDVYGDAPYDDFLDAWSAERFDADSWAAVFARIGARYVVPTTKHHDGIALWDAPGTGLRNTVRRGPRRDLVHELAEATRRHGMRFGVYYSGGLDWGVTDLPRIDTSAAVRGVRPNDAAYAAYAYGHLRDLVDRHRPDVLWNDIEWPDAGKHDGSLGLAELFRHYYASVPDGLVNDRFGATHQDFGTSEYQAHRESESSAAWEHCRGIGLSFGYNRVEDARHLLSGDELVRQFVDVVSRGGNLLLNVGPTAAGEIPPGQLGVLEYLGGWLAGAGDAIYGTRPLSAELAPPSDDPWIRWTARDGRAFAIVDATGPVVLPAMTDAFELEDGQRADGGIGVELPAGPGPAVVSFDLRRP
jgi:alpha-L-fucosidase